MSRRSKRRRERKQWERAYAVAESVNRKPGKKRSASKDRTHEARLVESVIRLVVEMHGITLAVTSMKCGRRTVPHWRFIREDFVLLHYWPSSGTYRTADGASGILHDMHMAGTLARYMATETDPSEDAALRALGAIG